ncbi:MAG: 1-deoxy-D-xylulose-5-phosphate synthase N-terminal domain-containing protein, partial [Hafnia sp.]
VDATTGLLGQGLSIALGMAAAKNRAGDPNRVFAIIGDGEMHEGQIWESLQQAAHMRMDNLVAIIDYNGFSSHDPVNDVINLEPLADKIRNFGWHVLELQDGNNMCQVADTLQLSRYLKGKPVAIIARTTKGSGVSYMENNGDWHSKTPSAEQYQQAMEELQS